MVRDFVQKALAKRPPPDESLPTCIRVDTEVVVVVCRSLARISFLLGLAIGLAGGSFQESLVAVLMKVV